MVVSYFPEGLERRSEWEATDRRVSPRPFGCQESHDAKRQTNQSPSPAPAPAMRPAVNALGPRAPPTARGLGSRWGRPSRAHPAVAQSFSRAASRGRGSPSPAGPPTIERVLRYPGGRERRIRYPAPPSDEDQEEDGRGCATASATAVSACEQEFRAGQIYEHGYCTPDDDGCMLNDLDWTADKMRPWGEPVSASPRGRNGSSRPELCLNKVGMFPSQHPPSLSVP